MSNLCNNIVYYFNGKKYEINELSLERELVEHRLTSLKYIPKKLNSYINFENKLNSQICTSLLWIVINLE